MESGPGLKMYFLLKWGFQVPPRQAQPRFLVEDIADCAQVVQDLLSRVEEIRDSLSGEGA